MLWGVQGVVVKKALTTPTIKSVISRTSRTRFIPLCSGYNSNLIVVFRCERITAFRIHRGSYEIPSTAQVIAKT